MTKRSLSAGTLRSATVAIVGAWLLTVHVLHAQPQTPTQTFEAYRKALAGATAYSEILPFMESKGRSMIESIPAANQAKMFDFLKKFAGTYSDVAVTKETVTGDTAVLELGGKDPKGQPATGSVPMTKEASGWKVGTEKWSSKPR
jgi:hypothetical protein